jgi:xylulokinase
VSATIGTSGVVFAATAKPLLDPKGRIHTFCHAVPNRWHVMGVTQAAGYSLRWFRDQFGAGAVGSKDSAEDPYDCLMNEAGKAPAGADGLLWAPYLMGERTPHLDAHARAALVRDTLTIFSELKLPVESIRLGGGGARGGVWRQVQADVYGMAADLVEAEEGPAYGAALLAGVGTGAWATVESACEAAVRVAKRVEPIPQNVALMDKQYGAFRKVYPALRGIMHDLSRAN